MKQKGFKYNVRKRIIQKAIRQNRRAVVFPAPGSIRSIGIVKEKNVDFDFQIKNLTANTHLVILNLVSDKLPKEHDQKLLSLKNGLNFWGLPTKKNIETFVSEPFDLLINFSALQNDVIDYICAKSLAKFKAGVVYAGEVYDLVIDQEIFNGSLFIDELEKAFRNFNTLN